MRKSIFNLLALVMTTVLVLTGCQQNTAVPAATPSPSPGLQRLSKEPVELEFWSYYAGWDSAIQAFENKYPNVTVKVKTFSFDTYTNEYLKAIADGNTPDVMLTDSEQFGQFTAINGVEDLQNYGAGKYQKDFSESLWNSNLSQDETKLVGFPLGTSPLVTYYRADIMKQYGFPSEPEELGKYMEDPENWLKIAKTLKKDNRYITQWSPEAVQIFESTRGLFDSNLNFLRNNDTFIKAIEISKQVNNHALEASIDIWTPSGAQAVNSGQLAMLYLGTWGAAQIKEWAPDSAGKWRETRLPFNQYGWVNSSNFILPSAAKNKDWAWKFIEFCVTDWSTQGNGDGVPAYLPARGNPEKLARKDDYYGGQKLYALHEELVQKMKEYKLTPLDLKARKIWSDHIAFAIERNQDAGEVLYQTQEDLRTSLSREIEILLKDRKAAPAP